jgi:pyrophosphate--fructose-6-phosphate 1-phosphotransferase
MVVEIQEINSLLKQDVSVENISSRLSPWAAALFDFLPIFIKKQVRWYSFLSIW